VDDAEHEHHAVLVDHVVHEPVIADPEPMEPVPGPDGGRGQLDAAGVQDRSSRLVVRPLA